MKLLSVLVFLSLSLTNVSGQADTTKQKVYRVSLPYEGGGSLVFIGVSALGFKQLDRVASFDQADVVHLDPNSVNAFDRSVIFNNPANYDRAQKRSDLFLNVSILSPLLLMADKRIRKDWLDLLTLYVATHAVDNAIYFASAYSVRRARPFTYNPDVPLETKVGVAKSNSFYSGHVSFSSTATFFLAKVFTDYHHIKGWKRVAIFSLVSVPPALVAYNRMEAGKHFKTDVMLGFAVGAASGILIPELHKRIKQSKSVALEPFFSATGQKGLTLNYHF
ncbi:phosphatase PAP2 family protein [Spirosoma linguale]|uniref:Phosphoesterase PA-phosphatase related protein n=1 Tax=Spirosoma linguale (strain ATCC 33905 / DSM 74 / LMG 10896 / Claus 1) TaxID=504472 RepID=D2QHX6_SPILD|nr:phosphoesterase PA-phosphatase related protein [Spirosoma linguale DSM 74]